MDISRVAGTESQRRSLHTVARISEVFGLPEGTFSTVHPYQPQEYSLVLQHIQQPGTRFFHIPGGVGHDLYATAGHLARDGGHLQSVLVLFKVTHNGYIYPLGVTGLGPVGEDFWHRVREATTSWADLTETYGRQLQLIHNF